jgi:integrase
LEDAYEEKRFHSEREGWDYKPEPRQILFEDYVKDWSTEILEKFPSDGKKRDFRQVLDDWLLPHFGNLTFYQITGVELQKFLSTLRWREGQKKGERLSRSRVRNILIPMRAIWADACDEHHWDIPDPFRFLGKHMPKGSSKHPEVFRFDELMQLLSQMDPFYKGITEIMVMTGMIGSEIAGLRKEDIEGDFLHIRNSIVRKHEKTDLKTDLRKRKLPITVALRDRLNAVLSLSDNNYVFRMKSGVIFDVDSFRKNPWTTAFRNANLEYKVPYATRHTFAAWALTLGTDPNKLVKLMGHSSKKMVYEVYGNYVEGLEEDAGKILEYFGKDFGGLKK